MSSIDWTRFTKIIKEHDRFLLTSHIRPDCDAPGSELGMAGHSAEPSARRFASSTVSQRRRILRFLDPNNELQAIGVDVTLEQLLADDFQGADGSRYQQRGLNSARWVMFSAAPRRRLSSSIITKAATISTPRNSKNRQSEATGRLVVEAAAQLGVKLTPEMASPIFSAIATDTGWFRFGSASSGTYRMAAI